MNQKLKAIADGWIELESDPGLFTLLIEDFGVKGVEVEEIYDLQSLLPGPVYGFIFLFKWIEGGRRSRRAKFELSTGVTVSDESIVNAVFFAHQKVQNSCATHAILSILMNCDAIDMGSTLSEFKSFTQDMCPEEKGFAFNNLPELVLAHNKHARPEAWRDIDEDSDKGSTIATSSSSAVSTKWQETFHFASFLPINGHLYEMDSLKPYPIDHGCIPEGIEWQQYFQQLISDRITAANEMDSHDIRYNLMALVPCKIDKLKENISFLQSNRNQIILALRSLIVETDPDVFRRVFQICSFSHRKKISDEELIQAAEYLLLVENDSSLMVADDERLSVDVSASTVENMAELECSSNSSTSNVLHFPIEDFELGLAPSSSRAVGSKTEASDVIELSEQNDLPSTSTFKSCSLRRKIVKIRFQPPSPEFESFTLRETLLSLKVLDEEIHKVNRLIYDECAKRQQFEVDDERRTHDYDDFLTTCLSMMAASGLLREKDESKVGKMQKLTSKYKKRKTNLSTTITKPTAITSKMLNRRKFAKSQK